MGTAVLAAGALALAQVKEYKSGIIWPEPEVISPGGPDEAPSDAVILFDGGDLSNFKGGEAWDITDGVATAAKRSIETKQAFGSCQIHLEFATPEVVKGSGQGRGNSGIYLMGQYEIQILDSYENETYFDGQCGSIYKQQPPMVNASRPPGEWQSYDILFEAPQFAEDGAVLKPAYVTVLHNGVMIHHHQELKGSTSYTEPPKYRKHPEKVPFSLQFHGNPVKFRNIWVRENVTPLRGLDPARDVDPVRTDTDAVPEPIKPLTPVEPPPGPSGGSR